MTDVLGPQKIVVEGEDYTFHSLDHLIGHIDFAVDTLRSFGSDYEDAEDPLSLEMIRKLAVLTIASLDLYDEWAPQVTEYWEQQDTVLRAAMRDLPAPFQEEPET